MKNFKIISLTLIACIGLGLSACNDFLFTPQPGTVNEDIVPKDKAKVEAVLLDAYNRVQGGGMYGGRIQRSAALFGDEIDFTFVSPSNNVWSNRLFSVLTNNPGESIWVDGYSAIFRANLVIAYSGAKTFPATQAEYDKLAGEAYFLRALCHFEVCRFFSKPYSDPARGQNPGAVLRLVAETSTAIANIKRQRSSVEDTYQQVLRDLDQAIALLPAFAGPGSDFRATKEAAQALKARVLFDMNQHADVLPLADQVIGDGSRFALGTPVAPFRNVNANSAGGVIFGLRNTTGDDGAGELRTSFFNAFNPVAVQFPLDSIGFQGNHATSLVYALRTGGAFRRDSLLTGSNPAKKITSKWRGAAIAGGAPTNVPVLRIAEMYLSRAESRFLTGNEAGARDDLNAIRAYAGSLTVDGSVAGPALLDSIRLERRRELFLENDRWHQLRRLQLQTGPNPNQPFSYNTDVLFPIPNSEINGNPNIQKNGNN